MVDRRRKGDGGRSSSGAVAGRSAAAPELNSFFFEIFLHQNVRLPFLYLNMSLEFWKHASNSLDLTFNLRNFHPLNGKKRRYKWRKEGGEATFVWIHSSFPSLVRFVVLYANPVRFLSLLLLVRFCFMCLVRFCCVVMLLGSDSELLWCLCVVHGLENFMFLMFLIFVLCWFWSGKNEMRKV